MCVCRKTITNLVGDTSSRLFSCVEMPVGLYAKTAFERGLPTHEAVISYLQPLLIGSKTSRWAMNIGFRQQSLLSLQCGKALSSRLRLPGRTRRPCFPSNVCTAREIMKLLPCSKSVAQVGAPEVCTFTTFFFVRACRFFFQLGAEGEHAARGGRRGTRPL